MKLEAGSVHGFATTSSRRGKSGRLLTSCLLKGPLGCLAFLAGAGAVLVLFLPAAAGRWIARSAEREFAEQHQGELAVRALELSWTRELRAELELRDPDGTRVARAEVRAPSITDVFGAEGEVVLRAAIEADLVQDEDGGTNLARALAPRGSSRGRTAVSFETGGHEHAEGAATGWRIELQPSRLTWTTPELRELGTRLEAFLSEGEGRLGEERSSLRAKGVLGTGAPLSLELRYAPREGGGLLDVTATLEGAPSAHLGAALRTDSPLEQALGEEIARLEVALQDALGPAPRLDLALEARRASLEARGTLRDGELVVDAAEALADEERSPFVSARFEPVGPWRAGALRTLAPFLTAAPLARLPAPPTPPPGGEPIEAVPDPDPAPRAGARPRVASTDARLPLRPPRDALAGTFELDLGGAPALLLAGAEGLEGFEPPAARLADAPPFTARLEGSLVRFEEVLVPLDAGAARVSGTYDREADELDLLVRLPAALVPAAEGEEAVLAVGGSASAPRVRLVEGASGG